MSRAKLARMRDRARGTNVLGSGGFQATTPKTEKNTSSSGQDPLPYITYYGRFAQTDQRTATDSGSGSGISASLVEAVRQEEEDRKALEAVIKANADKKAALAALDKAAADAKQAALMSDQTAKDLADAKEAAAQAALEEANKKLALLESKKKTAVDEDLGLGKRPDPVANPDTAPPAPSSSSAMKWIVGGLMLATVAGLAYAATRKKKLRARRGAHEPRVRLADVSSSAALMLAMGDSSMRRQRYLKVNSVKINGVNA